MQVAHIVPTDLLYLIENRNFYMCLANIASINDTYLEFYKRKAKEGKFVLLDNGEAEGNQMSLDTMYDMIKEINPSEVILNDVLDDREATAEKSTIALDFYKSKGYNKQLMFVMQGTDFFDWNKNILNRELLVNIQTVGIPKVISKQWENYDRYDCCKQLMTERYNIHLLGCNERIDYLKYFNNLRVRSVDTALAYLKAKANEYIDKGDRPNVKMDFINHQLTDDGLLKKNIEIFDKRVNL